MGMTVSRDAAADDPSQAAKLFDQGLADMQSGRHETGCPALAESYRLEPLPGVLFTLAECEASWGRLATALNHYDEFLKLLVTLPAEQAAKHKERRQIALEKVSGLSRLVPHLVIVVPSNPPDGLVIKRNGDVVSSSSWGVSVSLDPGDYELVAELPDGPVWTRTITLKQGERARADVELPAATVVEEKSTDDVVVRSNPYRTWAWVTAGLGAASLGVGAVSGIVVLGKKGTIDDECLDKLCTQKGKDAADSAQTWGMVSTIGVGAGIALGAASVWLFLKEPGEPSERSTQGAALLPWVVTSERGAAIGVEGSF
jgi:hypothetical protein